LSVPSSSGKTLQPRSSRSIAFAGNFQSPLHRGRLFNNPQAQTSSCGLPLSVPSSSGKTLQRESQATSLQAALPFSPLFIGEDSSTTFSGRRKSKSIRLSVPSSSGKTLQPLTIGILLYILLFFQSPLHRGRLFNDLRQTRVGLLDHFQSPLHRGRLFNGWPITFRLSRIRPFSPLFIGEDSSTSICTAWQLTSSDFQSPLHRGRLFNGFPEPAAELALQAFSPLFIGEDSSTSA